MSSRAILSIALVYAACVLGCSQADGGLPPAAGEVPNRIGDLGRNLDNISRGDASGEKDLADDLMTFAQTKPAADAPIADLSRVVAQALSGRTLSAESVGVLARQLWLTVAARDFSEKQIESLQADVRAAALAAGIAPEVAGAIATQAAAVQKVVTDRQRRWYEVF
jgi:TolB-like protein